MRTIRMAHLQDQGINFAVFDANAADNTDATRAEILADLTTRARAEGLRVEKSALAYGHGRGLRFYGTPDLVRYLARIPGIRWTHTLTVQ